jgi:GAG-pre-integrase domain
VEKLHVITKDGILVASSCLTGTNLYKMKCSTQSAPAQTDEIQYALSTTLMPPDWETWHYRFGHVSYDGLTKLRAHNLTEGFIMNKTSLKPDCIASIQVKQSEKAFGQSSQQKTKPGEMTHMDLWGKYEITSINWSLYYLLMIDDMLHYTMISLRTSKDQAAW